MLLSLLMTLCSFGGDGVYGAEIKAETPLVTLAELSANPEKYLGKVVKVEGLVNAVCPMAGCWLDVTHSGNKIRIKVKDGEIEFDQKLVGKEVIAEGTVYKFEMNKEEAINYYRHLAEEKGESFDPSSVTEGATIYQIGGLGVKTK